MFDIPTNISIPELWGDKNFEIEKWGDVNILVGANGTGKSMFAEQLRQGTFVRDNPVRYLNAERLAGLEKQEYYDFGYSQFNNGFSIKKFDTLKQNGIAYGLSSSAFIILKEKLNVRIKIEAIISDIFNKTIRLVEEGGYLVPKIQNIQGGSEYSLKKKECHGLKEIITLLTFLYDESIKVLILDEPELHLHPQFQSFYLSEIKKIANKPDNDPQKKQFFIITHSPYFLDIRTIEDLKNVFVFHYNKPPTYIKELDESDEFIIKKFLPRFNTHHKQFFFSPNPVFVEGYTDLQIISLLFSKLDLNISASGSCVIDVGGKDELQVFYKLAKIFDIDARVIADLDALIKSKFMGEVEKDERANNFIVSEGMESLAKTNGELKRKLIEFFDTIKNTTDTDISHIDEFNQYVQPYISSGDDESLYKKRVSCLSLINSNLAYEFPTESNCNQIIGLFKKIQAALRAANVFILPKGALENYFTQTIFENIFNLSQKAKSSSFHDEYNYILSTQKSVLEGNYSELLTVLKSSVPQIEIDIDKHIEFTIIEWIQKVQATLYRYSINSLDELKNNSLIEYSTYNQIIDIVDFSISDNKKFTCKIKIKGTISGNEKEVEFDESTVPNSFHL